MKYFRHVKYYVIAGEASGDLHGANLIGEISKMDPEATFRCWGGDLMEEKGAELVKHYKDLAFMGFAEVLFNLRTILANMKYCKADILEFQPDVILFIDYPGFNLRIAEFAHKAGFKTYYYISPQIWAWKENRIHKIKQFVDRMYVILPFEKDFYGKHNMPVHYLGHPLLDVIQYELASDEEKAHFRKENGLGERPLIALVPGSRKQEISRMLPLMATAINRFTDYQFVVAGAPNIDLSFYREFIDESTPILRGKTHDLYRYSEAGLITSGTATLEAALYGLPEIVCYKANKISYQIAKRLVKIKFISLVNLIADREVVRELIQDELNPSTLEAELKGILEHGEKRSKMLKDFEEIRELLGSHGASKKIASDMLKSLQE